MGSKERRKREKEATRQLILDAARDLFVDQGYEQVTMRKIAERIEYSPTAIYVHFADKDALMTELSICDFREFSATFQAVPRHQGPRQRLLDLGRAYVAFAQQHPNQYRLLFMTSRPHKHEEVPSDDAYSLLIEAVKAAMDAGLFHADWDDPHRIAQLMWTALHGIVALGMVMPPDHDHIPMLPVDELAKSSMELLFRGFSGPPPG